MRLAGFDRTPRGSLIHQLIDAERERAMGVAYERCVTYYKPPHRHDRPILVFPRGGCEMAVTITRTGQRFQITAEHGLVIPAGVEHDDRGTSSIYDTFALLPSPELAPHPFARCAQFRRSTWLDALLAEYFADRIVSSRSVRATALETLIVLEVSAACANTAPADPVQSTLAGPSSPIARALRFLDANLMSPLDLDAVAAAVAMSPSSLLRHFRAETGQTPIAYVRAQRLDAARGMLARADRNVSAVARAVGYTSIGAFSEAYRRQFGVSPTG